MLNFNNGVNPLQQISDGYKERGKSNPFTNSASDSSEALRKRFEADPNSLSPIELMVLGSYDLDEARRKKSEDNRIDTDKDAQKGDTGGEDDSEDKGKADALEAIKAEIAALNTRFAELNGGE